MATVTKFDTLNAAGGSAKIAASLPTTPEAYYGADTGDIDSVTWRGGEMLYLSTDNRLYIQQATSGRTATWKRLLTQFATSTSTTTTTTTTTSTSSSTTSSSSSTSTSTSSSTTTSTSSTSTSTSTTTSTSSSTSTSTSSSSTTTG